MKHFFILMTVILAASACGNSNESTAELSSIQPQLPTFTLVCSVSAGSGQSASGMRSARVTYSAGMVDMRLDRDDIDSRFDAAASKVIAIGPNVLSASWNAAGVSFSAREFRHNTFAGELQISGETVPVKCIKLVTDDRDDDEFSLACTPKDISATSAQNSADVTDVVLSYEERELEMFLNPTGDRQIFDLERTSELKVSDLRIFGEWGTQNTYFNATSTDGDRFEAVLSYKGSFETNLVCWKI